MATAPETVPYSEIAWLRQPSLRPAEKKIIKALGGDMRERLCADTLKYIKEQQNFAISAILRNCVPVKFTTQKKLAETTNQLEQILGRGRLGRLRKGESGGWKNVQRGGVVVGTKGIGTLDKDQSQIAAEDHFGPRLQAKGTKYDEKTGAPIHNENANEEADADADKSEDIERAAFLCRIVRLEFQRELYNLESDLSEIFDTMMRRRVRQWGKDYVFTDDSNNDQFHPNREFENAANLRLEEFAETVADICLARLGGNKLRTARVEDLMNRANANCAQYLQQNRFRYQTLDQVREIRNLFRHPGELA